MKETTMAGQRFGLRTLTFFGGAVLMLVPALVAGSLYTSALQRHAEALLVEKLTARGDLGAGQLARSLHQLWQEVDTLARRVDITKAPQLRQEINLVAGLDGRYSWIGAADVEGRVVAATRSLLEGESVAERPWFRRGLIGPTAVDVHQAQLLAKHMPSRAEPYRFIDLSAPIRQDDEVTGTLGAHVDWRWVTDTLASLRVPGVDIILLSRERSVLFGPADLIDKRLDVGSALAASRATGSVLDERWPDGRSYATVVVPAVGHADLPSFGWSLLVRQDLDDALAPTRQLIRSFWLLLGSGAMIALVLLFLGAQWISRPLTRLVGAAEAMTGGDDQKPPYRETRYEEAARLSRALVKLQSRLLSRPG
jgi:hypothetical protein